MLQLDVDEMFEMIERTFDGRLTADKYDVLVEASHLTLGADGWRAVEDLDEERWYTREQLRDALLVDLMGMWEERRERLREREHVPA